MTAWLGMQPIATTHGLQIDNLIGWIHIFMLILFVGWGGFFLYAVVRFRRSRNDPAEGDFDLTFERDTSRFNAW